MSSSNVPMSLREQVAERIWDAWATSNVGLAEAVGGELSAGANTQTPSRSTSV